MSNWKTKMKRIEYENVKNCETEYLKTLGFLDEKEEFTESYNSLNNNWKIIRGNKNFSSLLSLPEEVKDLLTYSYEKIVDYFLELQKLEKEDNKKLKKMFDKNEFNYDKFRNKIATFFKDNADKLKIHSCFYCDAAYTGVFSTEEEDRQTFDVDHFFPKSEYPMFSLSLYNFVPSCQVCNSRVKGCNKFLKFYFRNQKSLLRKDLLQISPASKKYDMDSNLTIKVYPQKQDKNSDKKEQKNDNNQVNQNEGSETDNEWHYTPVFSKNLENYRILFDIDENTAYEKVVKAFFA